MTYEETKKWLNRVYREEFLIKTLKEQREKIRQDITSIRSIDYSKDKVQTSGSNNAEFENKVHNLIELDNKISDLIDKQALVKNEIMEMALRLKDNSMTGIIIARHINFKHWIDIALDVSYSRTNCHYLYTQAVNEISLMLSKEV